MPLLKLVLAAVAALVLVHCATDTRSDDELGTQRAAVCLAEWTPAWRQGSGANEWWVEFTIEGAPVASAWLEVAGRPNLALASQWGKWSASAARIAPGTPVILHAETTAGAEAQTVAFAYLNETAPASDPCTASGSDAGACGFTPAFEQGDGANEWWVEFVISGSVRAASLQIAGGPAVTLASEYGKWRGKPSVRVANGASVSLRVESTTGQIAESATFRYLVDTRPAAKPCAASDAGSGGGTDAGTGGGCWTTTWQQGTGANEWWVEYAIAGSVRAATLVVGGQSVTLAAEWGKWTGKPSGRIAPGTTVVLRAENMAGAVTETTPFRYLVDLAPASRACAPGGTPDAGVPSGSGLDARPSNTTCLAPARPPNTAPVALTPVFADVFATSTPNRVTAPMLMAQRPGDASRWFLAERNGRIVSFNASGTTRDLRQVVSTAQLATLTGKQVTLTDESGFHGMAFDPSFATTGRLFVAFSTTCDGSVPVCDDPKNIAGNYYPYAEEIGYLTSSDGGATFTRYTRLLHVGRWSQMHYGGTVAFGKDGYLYVTSGEGLDDSAAQFNDNLFGKVLRLDVHGAPAPGKPYGIPPTNPFASGGGRPEIFAWGVRNPYRMSVDRQTGDIWLGDVGQDSYEEVNRIQLGGNYGWPCREGAHEAPGWNNPAKCPSRSGLIDPVMEHAHGNVGRSVTGGVVYRGTAIAGFQGTYVYGDFIQKELRGLTLVNGVWTSTILNGAGPQDGYVSFAEDVAGEIYAVSLFDQKIHKLVAGTTPAPSAFPERLSATGCFLAADPKKPAPGLVPYGVNAELWSDGAVKERWLAIPNGTRITVRADGDFDFPIGTVLAKAFTLAGRRVETRLFVRHSDGEWGGYSYEWNDAGTDATLLPSGKVKQVGTQSWTFPSRSECLLCHTTAAGRSLGLEVGQLNGTITYPQTGRAANQLKTLDAIGMFSAAIGDPATLTAYPRPLEGAASEVKARAYLHANCSHCHRPNGGAARSTMDLRFATPLSSTNTCNAVPIIDNFGSTATRLVRPGTPAQSIVSLRAHALDARRMPPLATSRVDVAGTNLLDAWIGALATCP